MANKDSITLKRIDLLHPKLMAEAHDIYSEICERLTGNAICRFTHTLRTFAEQDALYAKGRTDKTSGIVTMARSGQSYHNYGMAIDICLIIDGKELSYDLKKDYDKDGISDFLECVAVFKMYGWTWGGDWKTFKDYPHFEKPNGYSVIDLKKHYDAKNYISGTNYVNV